MKSLLKNAMDVCILPGTANGTEILWLYAKQWSKELSILTFAMISLASQVQSSSSNVHVISQHSVVEPDRHAAN